MRGEYTVNALHTYTHRDTRQSIMTYPTQSDGLADGRIVDMMGLLLILLIQWNPLKYEMWTWFVSCLKLIW